MPFAEINGIDLYYEVHGKGPVVVFAHGRNGSHLTWWQQVPAFSESFRVVTFDQRGFGQSLDVAERPGRSMFVSDLAALVDHLGLARISIVGQSMGGWTALGFAVAHPERMERLVLADTTAGIAAPPVLEAIGSRREPPQDFLERGLSGAYRKQNPAGTFLYAQIAGLNPPNPEPLQSLLEGTDGPGADVLGALDVPTLLVVGEHDPVVSPGMAETCAGLFPDATVEVFPQAGHSVYFEKPRDFNQKVINFLAAGPRKARESAA